MSLRIGALLLAATLVMSVPVAAEASHSPGKADKAADWLADELERNRMHGSYGGFNYTDWGLTVDTLFALSAEGSKTRRVNKIARVLSNHVEDYTGGGTERYAGASAKLLLAAKVARKNVRNFGGYNLRARVLNRVAARAPASSTGGCATARSSASSATRSASPSACWGWPARATRRSRPSTSCSSSAATPDGSG